MPTCIMAHFFIEIPSKAIRFPIVACTRQQIYMNVFFIKSFLFVGFFPSFLYYFWDSCESYHVYLKKKSFMLILMIYFEIDLSW